MNSPTNDDVVLDHSDGRANERPPLLVIEPLRRFLEEQGIGAGRLEPTAIGEGHSCVTYLLELDDRRVVLRRPPRPPVAPSTHDVLREARVLRALRGDAVPVPAVIAVCADDSVIGAPFYLMQEIEGTVITTTLPEPLDTVDQRAAIARSLVETLANLHAVDWKAVGLADLGRTNGYLERQLRRFGELIEVNRTRSIPALDRVGNWLASSTPSSPPPTLVHGDFRIGNAMFASEAPAQVKALLDWEMSTLGDPFADLGYFLATWYEEGDPPADFDLSPVTRRPGFPDRTQLISLYEGFSGRTTEHVNWYVTLALWKAAIFMEGNLKRVIAGESDDPYVKDRGEALVLEIAERAERIGPDGGSLS